MAPSETTLSGWFDQHRMFLWGLSYRITGSAADADDVVQETFVRAVQHAPALLDDPRRWLTRVAVNAARDLLRRRKRRQYVGPWLPTPIDTENEDRLIAEPPADTVSLEQRYGLLESASLAFLQALEILTPTQRATLLLCDVFDYSAAEVAEVLDIKEGNVRTVHHRARRAMESYDRRRSRQTPANRRRTARALEQFLALLAAGDMPGIERMLAADVRTVTDAAGEFTALFRPLIGRVPVARFFARFRATPDRPARVLVRSVNGFPAADILVLQPRGRRPPRLVISLDVDDRGRICEIRVMASSRKLATLPRESHIAEAPSPDDERIAGVMLADLVPQEIVRG